MAPEHLRVPSLGYTSTLDDEQVPTFKLPRNPHRCSDSLHGNEQTVFLVVSCESNEAIIRVRRTSGQVRAYQLVLPNRDTVPLTSKPRPRAPKAGDPPGCADKQMSRPFSAERTSLREHKLGRLCFAGLAPARSLPYRTTAWHPDDCVCWGQAVAHCSR